MSHNINRFYNIIEDANTRTKRQTMSKISNSPRILSRDNIGKAKFPVVLEIGTFLGESEILSVRNCVLVLLFLKMHYIIVNLNILYKF